MSEAEKPRFGFYPMWGLWQSVNLGNRGIGMKDKGDGNWSLFESRAEAESWLDGLMGTIRTEQGVGRRSARNLDPTYEGGLDFIVSPAYIVFDRRPMEERGWNFERAREWHEFKRLHPDIHPDADEAAALLRRIAEWERETKKE